jgi:hypothetical protein
VKFEFQKHIPIRLAPVSYKYYKSMWRTTLKRVSTNSQDKTTQHEQPSVTFLELLAYQGADKLKIIVGGVVY